MLLETLDVRKNDIVIYSENKPDPEDNFKIIFKQGVSRSPLRLSFTELCEFISDPAPKNLIIYRLLTNIKKLDPYLSKYGYFINNNGKKELFYFDPVYAVKDLKYLTKKLNRQSFRFKIQQVGLTTMTAQQQELAYSEVFSIDLKAIEAQNQNDKIFADAIFAFDPTYNDEKSFPTFGAEDLQENKLKNMDLLRLTEDKKETEENVSKIDVAEDKKNKTIVPEEKPIKKRAFADFIEKHKVNMQETKDKNEKEEITLDLFNAKKAEEERILREDKVLLKFNDE